MIRVSPIGVEKLVMAPCTGAGVNKSLVTRMAINRMMMTMTMTMTTGRRREGDNLPLSLGRGDSRNGGR
jgi:hypothetical protein